MPSILLVISSSHEISQRSMNILASKLESGLWSKVNLEFTPRSTMDMLGDTSQFLNCSSMSPFVTEIM